MAVDRIKTGKADYSRISIGLSHEVTYWAKQLNTSPESLKKAVAAVGPMVNDIKKWLSFN